MAQQAEAAQTTHERTVSPHVEATTEGVAVAAEPMSAHPSPSIGVTREMPRQANSVAFDAEYTTHKGEQDRAMESLANFQKFHPPTFTSEGSDPMIVESWINSMEKLFLNLPVLERDRVMLAVLLLEKIENRW